MSVGFVAVQAYPVCGRFENIGPGQLGAIPGPAAGHEFGVKSSRTVTALAGNPVLQIIFRQIIESGCVTAKTLRFIQLDPVPA